MTRPLNFIILLFFHVAAILADPVAQIEISQKNSQNPISHKPQPLDFPNERLYRAYLVIQRFKSSITSDPKNITATWTGRDICGEETYIGFYCGTPPGRGKELTVTAVILNGFDLHAPKLKGFVDQLPDLALFHAASNNLGSGLPRLGNLPYLYNLNTDNNLQTMEQAKPDGVSGKTQLTGKIRCISAFLNFRFNIGGSKGGDPGYTNSKAVLLNYNQLSGPLPSDLGFSKLSFLALANNKLTGSIPSSIEHLQDTLQEVLLLNNQLSGCLPHELGMLIKAAVIDAGMNQLTGPIPASFSCLTSVEQLNLGGNRLYGEIPDAFCKLAAGPAGRLANLTLSSNYFTSVGPSCLSLIKDGVLNVKKNCIPGLANQRRPAECASFLSQPKTCPAASATHVACPAAPANAAATPADRVAKDYSSYVTYATLHE